MLRDKDIKNISELKQVFVDSHKNPIFFQRMVEVLKLGKHHAIFSKVKSQGIPVLDLITIMIAFPFIGEKSIFSFVNSSWKKYAQYGKDAYYRLINNFNINWRLFLFAVVKRTLLKFSERELDSNKNNAPTGVKAFIFDDTPLMKTGKFIEGISRIWDHVTKKHFLGFHLLVMGIYNGSTFIPADFSLHSSKGKNKDKPNGLKKSELNKQFSKKRDKKSHGYLRKKELREKKTNMLIKMLKSAVKHGIEAQYVLTDSWYTCIATVENTIKLGMNYIGMFSIVRTKFTYNNKNLTYKEITHLCRKKTKRNKRFNLYYIKTVVDWNGNKVALYSIKKGKKGKWKYLINTDLSLTFTQTLEIYQVRWSIEVFFKECKQMLNLGKSQSSCFDAQIATISLTMIQHIFLSLQNNTEQYESLGKMFEHSKEHALNRRLHVRLIELLIKVLEVIAKLFEDADFSEIFEKVMYNNEAQQLILRLINYEEISDKQVA